MSLKYPSIPSKILAASITSAATSFQVNNINGWDGAALTSASFGSTAYGVFRNATKTAIEIFEFDPSTIASTSITITRRGLKFDGNLTTEVAANKLSWTKGDTYVDLGTDTPQMLQYIQEYIDAAIVAGGVPSTTSVLGLVKMSTAPASAANPIAVGDNDTRLPTQAENDAMAGDATPSSVNKFLTKGKSVTAGATINGATTPVPVYQNKTDNEFYACDANDTAAMKFVGFAISDGTDGNAMNVQFSGIVSGFTGLAEGEKYYVQDAVGTIGTSIGTKEILVGVAISETELVIQKGKRFDSGTVTFSSTSTTTVTVGFRVSRVRIHGISATTAANDVPKISNGGWTVAGGNDCVYIGEGSSSETQGGVNNSNAWYHYDASTTQLHNGIITNITDTSFDLANTKTGTPLNINLYWEAEGEL